MSDTSPTPSDAELGALLPSEEEVPPTPPRPFWRRRAVLVTTAVVLLAGLGLGLGLSFGLSSNTPAAGVSFTDEVETVGTGTIQQTVSASGTLDAGQQSDANFAVSGTVNAVDVSSGQKVTQGQTLATVGDGVLQADVDAAQASYAAAEARLTSDEDDDAVAAQVDSDEASVTQSDNNLSTAETNLSDATLSAPISGTVASVSLAVGQPVSGGGGGGGDEGAADSSDSSDSSGEVVIINTSSFVVSTTVDDTEVGQIALGDQVDITTASSSGGTTADGATGRSASATAASTNPCGTACGTVTSVGQVADQSSGVASFPVSIGVTGDPSGLYPGDSVNVSIIVKQLTDVTEVPTAALEPGANGETLTVVKDGRHVVTPVQVGEASGGETQILSGVKAGDKIIEQVVHFTAPAGAGTGGFGGFGGRGGLGGRGGFGGAGTGGFVGAGTGGFGGGGAVQIQIGSGG